MNKIIKRLFLLVFFIVAIILPNSSFASYSCPDGGTSYTDYDTCVTSSTCGTACKLDSETPSGAGGGGTVTLTNPIGTTDIPTLLGKVINSVMGVIGSLALAMFIYGGAVWMLSGGNQEQVTKGKNILIWAAVGIVIIFSAYALVKLVLKAVTS